MTTGISCNQSLKERHTTGNVERIIRIWGDSAIFTNKSKVPLHKPMLNFFPS